MEKAKGVPAGSLPCVLVALLAEPPGKVRKTTCYLNTKMHPEKSSPR
ncbi:hypothetical protein KP005_13630 [Geomonas nitrogeniifigens]|uniref:Uncharacterized protein n=1 Tax=Geomonas diazotrophica TaxID=2843197 RepID=A0ABX8JG09_9BACT|nr:hypothetical protein [Geomonas nitrogeniifigens]QWV96407.1 hypothetical protein KP005_13630 [Geomonas nitrogeniifigens]